jgi:hypothetical protein
MSAYQELQKELAAKFGERRARLRKSAKIIGNIENTLTTKFGFPKGAITYRANVTESHEESESLPDAKLELQDGKWAVTMCVRVRTADIEPQPGQPIALGNRDNSGLCDSFFDINIEFPDVNTEHANVAVGNRASFDAIELLGIPEQDQSRLFNLCEQIESEIKGLIEWIGSGKSDIKRPIGFHVGTTAS